MENPIEIIFNPYKPSLKTVRLQIRKSNDESLYFQVFKPDEKLHGKPEFRPLSIYNSDLWFIVKRYTEDISPIFVKKTEDDTILIKSAEEGLFRVDLVPSDTNDARIFPVWDVTFIYTLKLRLFHADNKIYTLLNGPLDIINDVSIELP